MRLFLADDPLPGTLVKHGNSEDMLALAVRRPCACPHTNAADGHRYLRRMLNDLLVVETAGVLAGPAVGMFFAELGARVVKLENPRTGGDVTRQWKLPSEDPASPVSAYFSSVNHGKEHRFVDLSLPDGRQELDLLLARADVLISNHMEKDTAKFGLERKRLRALNPRLVQGHLRGYAGNPARPAYDAVLQAETGYISMTGAGEDQLAKLPVALIDILAAHQLKEGLLLALLQRGRTGQGAYVEVSLEEAALTGLVNQATNWLMAGHVAAPLGTLHPNIAPYGELFRCADGERIILAVGSDAQFGKLCGVLGLPALPAEPRFATNAQRVAHRKALAALLATAMALHPAAGLLGQLERAGVPAGAVNPIHRALASPTATGMVREQTINGLPTARISGNAFRVSPL
ncbi:MAG: CoA transferase [Flavobacteriales bacterium]|nr:CoA transferase [Flavobacteriales bacterium]MBP9080131.1 CoA transferase [Flavobacteriales bacterium]